MSSQRQHEEDDITVADIAAVMLSPRRTEESVFGEAITWTSMSTAEKRDLLMPTKELDIDFIGVIGKAQDVLNNPLVKEHLFHNAMGIVFEASTKQIARFQSNKHVLQFATIGNYKIGAIVETNQQLTFEEEFIDDIIERPMQDGNGAESDRPRFNSRQDAFTTMRSYLDERLCGKGRHGTQDDIVNFVVETFSDLKIGIYSYGQKARFEDSTVGLRAALQSMVLTYRLHVDIALAAEFQKPGFYVSPSAVDYSHPGRMFSWLLSNVAGNILNTQPSAEFGSVHVFRLVVYNSCQHIKKLLSLLITLGSDRSTIISVVRESISAVISFVLSDVCSKVNTSKLRCEIYFNLNSTTLEAMSLQIDRYVLSTLNLVSAPVEDVTDHLSLISSLMFKTMNFLIPSTSYSHLFVVLEMYRLYTCSVFSLCRMTQSFLLENAGFSLPTEYFDPTTMLLNDQGRENMSVAKLKLDRYVSLFRKPTNVKLFLYIHSLLEWTLPVAHNESSNLIGKCRLEFNFAMTQWMTEHKEDLFADDTLDLRQLLQKLYSITRAVLPRFIMAAILSLADNQTEIFQMLSKDIAAKSWTVKVDRIPYYYVPVHIKTGNINLLEFLSGNNYEQLLSLFEQDMNGTIYLERELRTLVNDLNDVKEKAEAIAWKFLEPLSESAKAKFPRVLEYSDYCRLLVLTVPYNCEERNSFRKYIYDIFTHRSHYITFLGFTFAMLFFYQDEVRLESRLPDRLARCRENLAQRYIKTVEEGGPVTRYSASDLLISTGMFQIEKPKLPLHILSFQSGIPCARLKRVNILRTLAVSQRISLFNPVHQLPQLTPQQKSEIEGKFITSSFHVSTTPIASGDTNSNQPPRGSISSFLSTSTTISPEPITLHENLIPSIQLETNNDSIDEPAPDMAIVDNLIFDKAEETIQNNSNLKRSREEEVEERLFSNIFDEQPQAPGNSNLVSTRIDGLKNLFQKNSLFQRFRELFTDVEPSLPILLQASDSEIVSFLDDVLENSVSAFTKKMMAGLITKALE